MLDQQQSVATVVLEHSECAQVFQRHRIDFCCRGDLSVAAAAKDRGVDVEALLGELSAAIAERSGESRPDPRALSTPALVAHIVATHHEPLRRALPFAQTLAAKVGRVHGGHNPKLVDLHGLVDQLAGALLPHLDEEEQALFPAVTTRPPDGPTVEKLLASMLADHLAVARLLEGIREATEGFAVPDWGCNSYRALFSELEAIESDVFTHVHLENHVLRPRFCPGADATPQRVERPSAALG